MRNIASLCVVFLGLSSTVVLADVSGTWAIQGPIDPVCTLRQQGNAISGECRGPAAQGPVTGTAQGQAVRFVFSRTGRNGQTLPPVAFTGTQDGETLTGTAAMPNGPGSVFTARRTAAAPPDPATAKPTAPSLSGSVPAQVAAALNQTPPRTVFDVPANGVALHQQSQLACPVAVQDFPRVGTTVYDQHGFNVSCSFRNATGSLITLYVYGATGLGTIEEDYDGSRGTLVTALPTAKAQDKAVIVPPGAGWRSAGYVLPNGALTELHVAPLSEWRVKYRITFAASDTAAVAKAVEGLSDLVQKTAGAHLSACAASPKPARSGVRVSDPAMVQTYATATAAIAMVGLLKPVVQPRKWCTEGSFLIGQAPFLFWRNITPSSSNDVVDRITALTPIAPVLVFQIPREAVDKAAERLAPTAPLGDTPVFGVVVDTPDAMQVVGIFRGRPLPNDVMTLVARPNVGVYASVSKKPGGGITLFKPQ
jgi:hypothetical protein